MFTLSALPFASDTANALCSAASLPRAAPSHTATQDEAGCCDIFCPTAALNRSSEQPASTERAFTVDVPSVDTLTRTDDILTPSLGAVV
jgi:hypothetical protein